MLKRNCPNDAFPFEKDLLQTDNGFSDGISFIYKNGRSEKYKKRWLQFQLKIR